MPKKSLAFEILENLFHAHYEIGGKMCSLILYGVSFKNMINEHTKK